MLVLLNKLLKNKDHDVLFIGFFIVLKRETAFFFLIDFGFYLKINTL